MAITYDAPSTDWQTASRITVEPRITYPLPQELTAVFYEHDFVVNQAHFARTALDTVMASATMDGAINSSTTTIAVNSTDGFPCLGYLKINSERIPYTGRTGTTFTGCTVVSYHAPTTAYSTAYLVEETTPQNLEGTLMQYTKKFATVPDNWHEYLEAVFTFPGYYNDPADSDYRAPQSINCTVGVRSEYVLTSDPEVDLPVDAQQFRVVDSDLVVLDYLDDSSNPTFTAYKSAITSSDYINAAQSTLERYAGNIWVMTQSFTKAQ